MFYYSQYVNKKDITNEILGKLDLNRETENANVFYIIDECQSAAEKTKCC